MPGSASDVHALKACDALFFSVPIIMLTKYFALQDTQPPCNEPPPPPKPKPKRTKKAGTKAPKRATTNDVEPFEGGPVHARFDPPATQDAHKSKSILESEPDMDAVAEEADDPYEYLSQEALDGEPDDDTDSVMTYDDSDGAESFGTSPLTEKPVEPVFKRRTKASEAPVYSGPELWYESDSDEYVE